MEPHCVAAASAVGCQWCRHARSHADLLGLRKDQLEGRAEGRGLVHMSGLLGGHERMGRVDMRVLEARGRSWHAWQRASAHAQLATWEHVQPGSAAVAAHAHLTDQLWVLLSKQEAQSAAELGPQHEVAWTPLGAPCSQKRVGALCLEHEVLRLRWGIRGAVNAGTQLFCSAELRPSRAGCAQEPATVVPASVLRALCGAAVASLVGRGHAQHA